MEWLWRDEFANPHSVEHVLGWQADAHLAEASRCVAGAFGLPSDHVVFTSGATEANWLALQGVAFAEAARPRPLSKVITSAAEHRSVRTAAEAAARVLNVDPVILPIDSHGRVDPDRLHDVTAGDRALISIMAVGNEVGMINQISELRKACGEDAVFHVDASQAPAALDLFELVPSADLITLSSHKVYGPKGIGALIASPDMRKRIGSLMPGGSQQGGLRPGTLPTPLCRAFGAAMQLMLDRKLDRWHIADLRDRFVVGLQRDVSGVELVGDPKGRHPGNACVRFVGVDAADLLSALQPRIAASTQSACTSGSIAPSSVLLAMGLSLDQARECIRFSLGRFSDNWQVDEAVDFIATIAKQRRNL